MNETVENRRSADITTHFIQIVNSLFVLTGDGYAASPSDRQRILAGFEAVRRLADIYESDLREFYSRRDIEATSKGEPPFPLDSFMQMEGVAL